MNTGKTFKWGSGHFLQKMLEWPFWSGNAGVARCLRSLGRRDEVSVDAFLAIPAFVLFAVLEFVYAGKRKDIERSPA